MIDGTTPAHSPARPVDSSANRRPIVDVALAVLWLETDRGVRILISRRPEHVHLPGRWELPGGKVKQGESCAIAVMREVREELGIATRDPVPLLSIRHDYDDRTVRLHAFLLAAPDDRVPRPRGIIDHRWIDVRDLVEYDLPSANRPITQAILRRFTLSERGEGGPA
jgi:8-oxo-dGTP diphosphatase